MWRLATVLNEAWICKTALLHDIRPRALSYRRSLLYLNPVCVRIWQRLSLRTQTTLECTTTTLLCCEQSLVLLTLLTLWYLFLLHAVFRCVG